MPWPGPPGGRERWDRSPGLPDFLGGLVHTHPAAPLPTGDSSLSEAVTKLASPASLSQRILGRALCHLTQRILSLAAPAEDHPGLSRFQPQLDKFRSDLQKNFLAGR